MRLLISLSLSLRMLKKLVEPQIPSSLAKISSPANLTLLFFVPNFYHKPSFIFDYQSNIIKCNPFLESLNRRFLIKGACSNLPNSATQSSIGIASLCEYSLNSIPSV